jgi:hypothetical protein
MRMKGKVGPFSYRKCLRNLKESMEALGCFVGSCHCQILLDRTTLKQFGELLILEFAQR